MSVLAVLLILLILTMLAVRQNTIFNLLRNRDVNHAKCISHVSHYTGDQFAAQVLLAAAEDYASPEGQHELAVIIHAQGDSIADEPIPSLWMRRRAVGLQRKAGL